MPANLPGEVAREHARPCTVVTQVESDLGSDLATEPRDHDVAVDRHGNRSAHRHELVTGHVLGDRLDAHRVREAGAAFGKLDLAGRDAQGDEHGIGAETADRGVTTDRVGAVTEGDRIERPQVGRDHADPQAHIAGEPRGPDHHHLARGGVLEQRGAELTGRPAVAVDGVDHDPIDGIACARRDHELIGERHREEGLGHGWAALDGRDHRILVDVVELQGALHPLVLAGEQRPRDDRATGHHDEADEGDHEVDRPLFPAGLQGLVDLSLVELLLEGEGTERLRAGSPREQVAPGLLPFLGEAGEQRLERLVLLGTEEHHETVDPGQLHRVVSVLEFAVGGEDGEEIVGPLVGLVGTERGAGIDPRQVASLAAGPEETARVHERLGADRLLGLGHCGDLGEELIVDVVVPLGGDVEVGVVRVVAIGVVDVGVGREVAGFDGCEGRRRAGSAGGACRRIRQTRGMPRLVLASSSPRRRELLGRLALDFSVAPADIDERVRPGEDPTVYVERLACEKAARVAATGTVVLAADTAVVVDDEILGKPVDDTDAARMLRRLSGRSHLVVTGVCVHRVDGGSTAPRVAVAAERTVVQLDELTETRLAWYVGTGEADDKAGAYGLQGAAALFADRVDGSTTNVIGLPLPLVGRLFGEVDLDLLDFRATR